MTLLFGKQERLGRYRANN